MRVAFGDFLFDLESRELRRDGCAVPLSPKAFLLLHELLRVRPRALSKAELQERLWPDTFVSESNLASLAAEVRRALGEHGRQGRLLRTVHGFGYAFAGEARDPGRSVAAAEPPVGRLTGGDGRTFDIAAGEHFVGRDPDSPLFLDDATVSRRHARIAATPDRITVEDLGSKNGTFVQGRKANGPTPLVDGDEVQFGSVFLTFRHLSPLAPTATAHATPLAVPRRGRSEEEAR